MTVSLDTSVLLAYYQAKEGVPSSTSGSSTGATATASTPTAPWNASTTASSGAASSALDQGSALAQSILVDGTKLIDSSSAKLSVSTSNAAANTDYQNLFALYQGLTSLQTLANAAGSSNVPSSTLTQLQSAFANGVAQVQSFITSDPFKEFQVGDGTVTTNDETTAGVPQETDTYTTGLTATSANTVLPQLTGNVAFTATIQPLQGPAKTVDFNLADLGSTPRTLANVVTYLNAQLAAAGVTTRFSDQLISAGTSSTASSTVASSASSTTSSSGSSSGASSASGATSATDSLPQIALTIQGSALETVSFSAASTTPAVYVAQTSTEPVVTTTTDSATTTSATSSTATTPAPITTSQVLALDPTGQNAIAVGDKLWTDNLPSNASVQASTTAPDGSVYVLADVTGAANGQAIQGSQDVALLKYDNAGDLVYTRTLGAATSASGYALAVSPDGSQVAVAGTVTGTLDPTDTVDEASTTSQSFVTVYDTSAGDELWTQTQAAGVDNQANGVAFGSDNTVYVAGASQGSLNGAPSTATEQGYLQTYSAKSTTDKTTGETTWASAPVSTLSFGTSGVNRATGIAVDGSNIYVASVQNGEGVVSAYQTGVSGAPTLSATQDLGALQGGALNAVAVGADGSVYVAGSTHNAALNAGTITSAYGGDGDAFVARLAPGLGSTDGDTLTYLNNGGATTATALAVSVGQVFVTGQTATGASATGPAVSELGYAAEIDPTTGQTSWDQAIRGAEGNAAPTSIAVDASGASSLNALGLPTGAIGYTSSSLLVANTSLRPGDSFSVQVGAGAPTTVTIAADDTYSTLALKIQQVSGYRVSAITTTAANGDEQLEIKPASGSTQAEIALEAGPSGADALGALGLKAGLVTNASPISAGAATTAANSLKGAYTVNVPTTLSLSTSTSVAAARTQIATAIAEVQSIYSDLSTPKSATASASSSSNANDSALITFYNNQAAGYATALARLTASTTTSTA